MNAQLWFNIGVVIYLFCLAAYVGKLREKLKTQNRINCNNTEIQIRMADILERITKVAPIKKTRKKK